MKNLKYLGIMFALLFTWSCEKSETATPSSAVSVTITSAAAVKTVDTPLIAVVAGSTNQEVTWTLVSTTPADDTTVTVVGTMLKTTATTAATSARVKAVSKADTSKSVEKDITIGSPVTALAITSTGPATKGTDYTLAATVTTVAGITPAPDQTVTWTLVSTTPANDTNVTIVDGKLKATAATTATMAKVKAMSNADNAMITMVDITINASSGVAEPTPVSRSTADYQGMIVGSSGHFYVKIQENEKTITIKIDLGTVDAIIKTISSTGTPTTTSAGKEYTFTGGGYNIVIVVNGDEVTVKTLEIPGHAGAIAEIAKVIKGAESGDEKIYEGTSTAYLVKAPGTDAAATPAITDDNRIELVKYNYNAVLKGNKLIVMSKLKTGDDELARLKAHWRTKGISIADATINYVKGLNPTKNTYTLTRTANGITVTKDGESLVFDVTTEDGKEKLTLPYSTFELPIEIKDTAKSGSPIVVGKIFIEADLSELR